MLNLKRLLAGFAGILGDEIGSKENGGEKMKFFSSGFPKCLNCGGKIYSLLIKKSIFVGNTETRLMVQGSYHFYR